MLTPVMLPPGWLRLATSPILTGSNPAVKTIGIAAVDLTPDEIGCEFGQPIVLVLCKAVFERHILAFDKPGFIQALTERSQKLRVIIAAPRGEYPDHRGLRLLRTRRERPGSRTAKDRDELAPLHVLPEENVCAMRKPSTLGGVASWK